MTTPAAWVEALGPGRVHCVSMPSRYSSEGTRGDARLLAAASRRGDAERVLLPALVASVRGIDARSWLNVESLDAISRGEMQEWLARTLSADGRTVLLVSHDLEEALYLADRVLVLSARPGRVVKELRAPDPRAPDRDGAVTDPEFVAAREAALRALREGATTPAVPFAGGVGKRNSGTEAR